MRTLRATDGRQQPGPAPLTRAVGARRAEPYGGPAPLRLRIRKTLPLHACSLAALQRGR